MIDNFGTVAAVNGNLVIKDVRFFDPDLIFDCGQCFRFEKCGNVWRGIALDEELSLEKNGNDLVIYNCSEEKFREKWADYLGLNDDYGFIRDSFPKDDTFLQNAMKTGEGIRILHQDRFEALISFIISQNNNISRIKKCVRTVCENYGEKTSFGFLFPTPEALASADPAHLGTLGLGYRDEYIRSVSADVLEGRLSDAVIESSSGDEAVRYLMRFKGIGLKVASCVALFGYRKFDAFPVDVWMKKILDKYYSGMKDGKYFGYYAGIAQQYLFYYERWKNTDSCGKENG